MALTVGDLLTKLKKKKQEFLDSTTLDEKIGGAVSRGINTSTNALNATNKAILNSPLGVPGKVLMGAGSGIAQSAQASADYGRRNQEYVQKNYVDQGRSRFDALKDPTFYKNLGLGGYQGVKTVAQINPTMFGGAKQAIGYAGLPAAVSAGIAKFQGKDASYAAGQGLSEGMGMRPILSVTNPLTNKALSAIGGKAKSIPVKQVAQRSVAGLANLGEDELLARLDGLKTNPDKLFSFVIGASSAGNIELSKALKNRITRAMKPKAPSRLKKQVVKEVSDYLRDSKGRFTKEVDNKLKFAGGGSVDTSKKLKFIQKEDGTGLKRVYSENLQPMYGAGAGIEFEKDDRGKLTGKVNFNSGKAALGVGVMGGVKALKNGNLKFDGNYSRGDLGKVQGKIDELIGYSKGGGLGDGREMKLRQLESYANEPEAKAILDQVSKLENIKADISEARLNPNQTKLQTPEGLQQTPRGTKIPLNLGDEKLSSSLQDTPLNQLETGRIKLNQPQVDPQSGKQSQSLDGIISEGRKSIGESQLKSDSRSLKQVLSDTYTQWVDRFNPITKASKVAKDSLKKQGAELRPEHDPEYLVRRLTGAGGIADYRFNNELKPIIDEVDASGIPKVDMDTYLAHNRMAGFGDIGREIYGANPEKSRKIVAALEQKYSGIKSVAQKLYDYQERGLRELEESGFFSKEDVAAIRSQNPNYAPLQRVMDELNEYLGLPTRKTMQGSSPVKKIKGSKKKIDSPLENIIANTFSQRAAIEKNRVAQSIVDLQKIADLGFKQVGKAGDDTITVWNNGQKQFWQVGTEIAETAKGLNEENMNTVLKILQAPASLLRQGATGRNPDFMIPNVVRDQLDAAITSKYGYIPFVDYFSGLKSMLKNDEIYQKWANSGANIDLGEMSGRKSIRASFDEKTGKKNLFSWIGAGLDVMGKYSEQPTRIGLFKKAYKKTGNELLSAMESRDATVDFARMGSKMKVANSIIPFLNVQVQGFDKLIRSIKDNPGKVALNMAIYGALPAITTTLYNIANHQEEYAEIPQFERDSNFILIKGRNEDGAVDYLTFPKGNILPVVANPTQSFIEFLAQEDKQSFSQLAMSLLSETVPVLSGGSTLKEIGVKTVGSNLPQAVKPITENLVNKSFYKYDENNQQSKDIVPYFLQDKEAYKQSFKHTPEMYKKIGAIANVSPLQVQNLMEGYLAGYSKIPANIIDMLTDLSNNESISKNQVPVLRRFIKQTYPNSGEAKEKKVISKTPFMQRMTAGASASEGNIPIRQKEYIYDEKSPQGLNKLKVNATSLIANPVETIKLKAKGEPIREVISPKNPLKFFDSITVSERAKGVSDLDGGDKTTEVDHIIDKRFGGREDTENYQVLAEAIHQEKTNFGADLMDKYLNGEVSKKEAQQALTEYSSRIGGKPVTEEDVDRIAVTNSVDKLPDNIEQLEKIYTSNQRKIENYQDKKDNIIFSNKTEEQRQKALQALDADLGYSKALIEKIAQEKPEQIQEIELSSGIKQYKSGSSATVEERANWIKLQLEGKSEEERQKLINRLWDEKVLTSGSNGTAELVKELGMNPYSYTGTKRIKLGKKGKKASIRKVKINLSSTASKPNLMRFTAPKIELPQSQVVRFNAPKTPRVKFNFQDKQRSLAA